LNEEAIKNLLTDMLTNNYGKTGILDGILLFERAENYHFVGDLLSFLCLTN